MGCHDILWYAMQNKAQECNLIHETVRSNCERTSYGIGSSRCARVVAVPVRERPILHSKRAELKTCE